MYQDKTDQDRVVPGVPEGSIIYQRVFKKALRVRG